MIIRANAPTATPDRLLTEGISTMLNQQHMADNLKAVVLDLPTPAQRRQGMEAVKRLEKARLWDADIFEAVVHQSVGFDLVGGDLIRVKGNDKPIDAVVGLVDAYMKATGQTDTQA